MNDLWLSVRRQGLHTWAVAALLVGGLVLSRAYFGEWRNPHTAFFVWIPSAIGALGLGSWVIRMTLLRKDVDSLTGAIVGGCVLLAVAIVIAGAL